MSRFRKRALLRKLPNTSLNNNSNPRKPSSPRIKKYMECAVIQRIRGIGGAVLRKVVRKIAGAYAPARCVSAIFVPARQAWMTTFR